VSATWSDNQPGPFQTEIFATTLAAALVITAKQDNEASIVTLRVVDHFNARHMEAPSFLWPFDWIKSIK
jgi:hypothetical protein